MPYEMSIKKALKKLDEAANILGGIALLGNLNHSDSEYISAIQFDITAAMSDLEDFRDGLHNSEE